MGGALALAGLGWIGVAAVQAAEEKAPAAAAAAATEGAPAAGPEDPLIEPAAVEAVRKMVKTLETLQRVSYTVETDYDAIQEDGEAIEFGATIEETIRRPDHVRMERWDRNGQHVLATYDGRVVTVYDPEDGVYANTPRTGDVDSVVDFLRDDVGMKLPLADLFASDLGELLLERTVSAQYVDVQQIGDYACDHVALRSGDGIGIQFWIRQGAEALPQRVVITYERARGRPQFRANFSDWDLSPRVPDRLFVLDIPANAKLIPFVLPKRQPAAMGEEDTR